MKFHLDTAEVYIPDAIPVEQALARTTHLCIAAHQDENLSPVELVRRYIRRFEEDVQVRVTNKKYSTTPFLEQRFLSHHL